MRIVAISENLLPAAMGGEQSLIEHLGILAGQHEVHAFYRHYGPPDGAAGQVQYHFLPAASHTELVDAAVSTVPDVILAARHYWGDVSALPVRRIAYVCYWTQLVDQPAELETGRATPNERTRDVLRQYDAILANSHFTKRVLMALGQAADRIFVCNPATRPMAAADTAGDLVVAVGRAKHREDVLAALPQPAEVLDYDARIPTHRTDRIEDYLRRAAVVAHPTFLSESYCRAAVEAMESGVPLVYTAAGNLPELIGRSAGIPMDREATPEQWRSAIEQARCEPWRRRSARRRGVAIRDTHATATLLPKAVQAVAVGRTPWRWHLATPSQYPGVAAACNHLAECHQLNQCFDLPERFDNLILGSIVRSCLDQVPTLSAQKRVSLWWHSDVAQSGWTPAEFSFLAQAMHLVRSESLYAILPTSMTMVNLLRSQGIRAYWLPDVVGGRISPQTAYRQHERPAIGDLTTNAARKNHAVVFAAAALTEGMIYTFPRVEQAHGALMDALGVRRAVYDPRSKQELYDLLATLTCCPVVSAAETFCYQAVEAIYCGCPVIAGPSIPALRGLDDGFSVLPDPNDSDELARRILYLHEFPDERARLAERQRMHVEEIDFLHKRASYRTLCEVLA